MKYPFIAKSKTDPNGENGGLGFPTKEQAEAHRDNMNSSIASYPMNWNTDFWKGVPEPWEVIEK